VLCLVGIVSLAFGAQGFAEGRAFRGCAGAVGADVAVYAAYILDSFTKPFVGRDPGRLRRRFSGFRADDPRDGCTNPRCLALANGLQTHGVDLVVLDQSIAPPPPRQHSGDCAHPAMTNPAAYRLHLLKV
jgi:hypothetical protein